MLRWELATATAGAILGLDPFDQPDVDLAKHLAGSAMTDPVLADDPKIVDAGAPSTEMETERSTSPTV